MRPSPQLSLVTQRLSAQAPFSPDALAMEAAHSPSLEAESLRVLLIAGSADHRGSAVSGVPRDQI